jgi:hypothetical protein
MRNKDTILLENAYLNVFNEMAIRRREAYGGSNTAIGYGKKIITPGKVQAFNVRNEKDRKLLEDALKNALDFFKSDPNSLEAVNAILNILKKFKDAGMPITDLEHNKETLDSRTIIEMILKTLSSDENPQELLAYSNYNQYMYGVKSFGSMKTEKRPSPIPGRSKELFDIFKNARKLLNLPVFGNRAENVAIQSIETRDEGETPEEDLKDGWIDGIYYINDVATDLDEQGNGIWEGQEYENGNLKEDSKGKQVTFLYYFAKRFKCFLDGELVGYSDKRYFWANERGIELEVFDEEMLNDKNNGGWHGYRKINKTFIPKYDATRLKFIDPEVFVYKYNGYVPARGVVEGILFDERTNRVPRYEGEPKWSSPPMLVNLEPKNARKLKEAFRGKNKIQIEELLDSNIAKDIFEELYPEEKYPFLYKGGGGEVLSGERPDSIAVPYNP